MVALVSRTVSIRHRLVAYYYTSQGWCSIILCWTNRLVNIVSPLYPLFTAFCSLFATGQNFRQIYIRYRMLCTSLGVRQSDSNTSFYLVPLLRLISGYFLYLQVLLHTSQSWVMLHQGRFPAHALLNFVCWSGFWTPKFGLDVVLISPTTSQSKFTWKLDTLLWRTCFTQKTSHRLLPSYAWLIFALNCWSQPLFRTVQGNEPGLLWWLLCPTAAFQEHSAWDATGANRSAVRSVPLHSGKPGFMQHITADINSSRWASPIICFPFWPALSATSYHSTAVGSPGRPGPPGACTSKCMRFGLPGLLLDWYHHRPIRLHAGPARWAPWRFNFGSFFSGRVLGTNREGQ